MKLRSIFILITAMALAAGSAFAQDGAIDILTADGLACQADIASPIPGSIAIFARLGGQTAAGITGAEFQITGKDATWFAISTPNPAANLILGDPFGGGANIAFPTCQEDQGTGLISLYTVTIIAGVPIQDSYLSVEMHSTPSNPNFLCPLMTLCDAPAFTKVCVNAGQFIINPVTQTCNVAVEETSWSAVKGLYSN